MIDQELIGKCNWEFETFDALSSKNQVELLANYVKLIEQNAELHKELAKFREQSFTVHSNIKCSDIPDNLAM